MTDKITLVENRLLSDAFVPTWRLSGSSQLSCTRADLATSSAAPECSPRQRWLLPSPEMAVDLARDGCCHRQRWPLTSPETAVALAPEMGVTSPEMDVTSPEMAVTVRRITSPEMAVGPAWNPRKAIFAHIIRLYRRIGLRLGGGLSRGRAYPTFAIYSLGVSSV